MIVALAWPAAVVATAGILGATVVITTLIHSIFSTGQMAIRSESGKQFARTGSERD